jgi:hypothetical protein
MFSSGWSCILSAQDHSVEVEFCRSSLKPLSSPAESQSTLANDFLDFTVNSQK